MNNKLVKLRGTRTQEEIANAIGISISAIGMYETGQRVPRDEIKVKLANFYNVSVTKMIIQLLEIGYIDMLQGGYENEIINK